MYMHGLGCWQSMGPASTADAQPSIADVVPMHELFHTFGAQHPPELTADQRSQRGSSLEYYELVCDLMTVRSNTCTAYGWFLDPLQKFYYSSSGFTDSRLDTYDSRFLTPPLTK